MKSVKMEVNLMMTYENGNHGSETIFVVKDQSLSKVVHGGQRELRINL